MRITYDQHLYVVRTVTGGLDWTGSGVVTITGGMTYGPGVVDAGVAVVAGGAGVTGVAGAAGGGDW